jgi:hypothetical protein
MASAQRYAKQISDSRYHTNARTGTHAIAAPPFLFLSPSSSLFPNIFIFLHIRPTIHPFIPPSLTHYLAPSLSLSPSQRPADGEKRIPEENAFRTITKTPSSQSTQDKQPQPPPSLVQARNPRVESDDRDGQTRTTLCLEEIGQASQPTFVTSGSSPVPTLSTAPGSPTLALSATPKYLGQVRICPPPGCARPPCTIVPAISLQCNSASFYSQALEYAVYRRRKQAHLGTVERNEQEHLALMLRPPSQHGLHSSSTTMIRSASEPFNLHKASSDELSPAGTLVGHGLEVNR